MKFWNIDIDLGFLKPNENSFFYGLLDVVRVINERKLLFVIFLSVNFFFGALGIWAPMFAASISGLSAPGAEFGVVLGGGNGYFFSLALVAASSAYLAREYFETKQSEYREFKNGMVVVVSFFIVIVLVVVFIEYTAYLAQFLAGKTKGPPFHNPLLQICVTTAAFVIASYMFCVEQIDDLPQYGFALRKKQREKTEGEMNAPSKSDIKA